MAKQENKEKLAEGILNALIVNAGLEKKQIGDYKVIEKINSGHAVLKRTIDNIWSNLDRYYPEIKRDDLPNLTHEKLKVTKSTQDINFIAQYSGTKIKLYNIQDSERFYDRYFGEMLPQMESGYSSKGPTFHDRWIVDPKLDLTKENEITAIKKFEEILRKPLVSEIRISNSLEEALIPNETHAQIKSLMKEIHDMGINIYFRQYPSVKYHHEYTKLIVSNRYESDIKYKYPPKDEYHFEHYQDSLGVNSWRFANTQDGLEGIVEQADAYGFDGHHPLPSEKFDYHPIFSGSIITLTTQRLFFISRQKCENCWVQVNDGHNLNFDRLKYSYSVGRMLNEHTVKMYFDKNFIKVFDVIDIEDFFSKYYWYYDIASSRMYFAPKDSPDAGISNGGGAAEIIDNIFYSNLPDDWTFENSIDFQITIWDDMKKKYSD